MQTRKRKRNEDQKTQAAPAEDKRRAPPKKPASYQSAFNIVADDGNVVEPASKRAKIHHTPEAPKSAGNGAASSAAPQTPITEQKVIAKQAVLEPSKAAPMDTAADGTTPIKQEPAAEPAIPLAAAPTKIKLKIQIPEKAKAKPKLTTTTSQASQIAAMDTSAGEETPRRQAQPSEQKTTTAEPPTPLVPAPVPIKLETKTPKETKRKPAAPAPQPSQIAAMDTSAGKETPRRDPTLSVQAPLESGPEIKRTPREIKQKENKHGIQFSETKLIEKDVDYPVTPWPIEYYRAINELYKIHEYSLSGQKKTVDQIYEHIFSDSHRVIKRALENGYLTALDFILHNRYTNEHSELIKDSKNQKGILLTTHSNDVTALFLFYGKWIIDNNAWDVYDVIEKFILERYQATQEYKMHNASSVANLLLAQTFLFAIDPLCVPKEKINAFLDHLQKKGVSITDTLVSTLESCSTYYLGHKFYPDNITWLSEKLQIKIPFNALMHPIQNIGRYTKDQIKKLISITSINEQEKEKFLSDLVKFSNEYNNNTFSPTHFLFGEDIGQFKITTLTRAAEFLWPEKYKELTESKNHGETTLEKNPVRRIICKPAFPQFPMKDFMNAFEIIHYIFTKQFYLVESALHKYPDTAPQLFSVLLECYHFAFKSKNAPIKECIEKLFQHLEEKKYVIQTAAILPEVWIRFFDIIQYEFFIFNKGKGTTEENPEKKAILSRFLKLVDNVSRIAPYAFYHSEIHQEFDHPQPPLGYLCVALLSTFKEFKVSMTQLFIQLQENFKTKVYSVKLKDTLPTIPLNIILTAIRSCTPDFPKDLKVPAEAKVLKLNPLDTSSENDFNGPFLAFNKKQRFGFSMSPSERHIVSYDHFVMKTAIKNNTIDEVAKILKTITPSDQSTNREKDFENETEILFETYGKWMISHAAWSIYEVMEKHLLTKYPNKNSSSVASALIYHTLLSKDEHFHLQSGEQVDSFFNYLKKRGITIDSEFFVGHYSIQVLTQSMLEKIKFLSLPSKRYIEFKLSTLLKPLLLHMAKYSAREEEKEFTTSIIKLIPSTSAEREEIIRSARREDEWDQKSCSNINFLFEPPLDFYPIDTLNKAADLLWFEQYKKIAEQKRPDRSSTTTQNPLSKIVSKPNLTSPFRGENVFKLIEYIILHQPKILTIALSDPNTTVLLYSLLLKLGADSSTLFDPIIKIIQEQKSIPADKVTPEAWRELFLAANSSITNKDVQARLEALLKLVNPVDAIAHYRMPAPSQETPDKKHVIVSMDENDDSPDNSGLGLGGSRPSSVVSEKGSMLPQPSVHDKKVAPVSTPLKPSERKPLFEKKDEHAQEIEDKLTPNFTIASAFGRGDCFFDSVAQELRKIGKEIPGNPEHSDPKKLRVLCSDYLKSEDKSHDWAKEITEQDAKTGGANLKKCQEMLEYTQPELDAAGKFAVWGRPRVEGRILCQLFNIQMHLIEFEQVAEHFVCEPRLINANEMKSAEASLEDPNIIHLAGYRSHFVPIHPLKRQAPTAFNAYTLFAESKEPAKKLAHPSSPSSTCGGKRT